MNRQWLLHERPVGMIGPEHFKYVETDIPEPGDGEVLIRNLMFSLISLGILPMIGRGHSTLSL